MSAADRLERLIAAACRTAEELGVSVFPVRVEADPGIAGKTIKRPLVKGWQAGTAASNPAGIDELFQQHAGAVTHAGVVTGGAGRLLVLDLDGEAAQAWWREHSGMLPATRTVDTRRPGGKHLYYRMPRGVELRNSAGKLAPHVDVRSDGGFVVDWSIDNPPVVEEVADAPLELIEFIRRASTSSTTSTASTSTTTVGGKIGPGGRNEILSREAFRLRKQGMEPTQILDMVRTLNRLVCEPPLEDEELEAIAHGKRRVLPDAVTVDDFYAYMPSHSYIFVPSRELWPSASVNARLPAVHVSPDKTISASAWLDQRRPVDQAVWAPGLPTLIQGRLISGGGWIERPGSDTFNLYIPPAEIEGDPAKATPWLEHIHRVYPQDAEHIVRCLAHRVQRPGEKINHALFLGGVPGIGKDTMLEPLKAAVGPWNFVEVSPKQLLGRFNGWLKSIILRVSEARDMGDIDRFALYESLKTIEAAPPDVLRCDEKNLREHSVMNVCAVVITSNHKTDGIYLPADDRRHYVAWSDLTQGDFPAGYWRSLYGWYESGGSGHVAAYLSALDLSSFDPKAPPPKTPAFWDIVDANRAPEDAEIVDVLDSLDNPAVVTIGQLCVYANDSFREWLQDRRNARQIPHRLESAGYIPVRNDGQADGRWKLSGKNIVVYGRRELSVRDRIGAASRLCREGRP